MGTPSYLDAHAMPPIIIRVRPDGDGKKRVIVEGELDLASSPLLASAIEDGFTGADELLLDLSGVRFIDSAGLRAILEALQKRGSDAKVLQINSSLREQARRLFEMTGVLSQLPLVDVR